jgi:hypothetical protein
MTTQYSIACEEGGDLVAYRTSNTKRVEVFRGKEYLWYYLLYCMDHGQMHKSQRVTYDKGYQDAIFDVISEFDLTVEQQQHLQEIADDRTNYIKEYETDYSDFT